MNFMKANLLPRWQLPDLLPYFYKLNKKNNAVDILRRALASSSIKFKVLSNNMLAYSILVYLDTKAEMSFKQYLKAFFDLSVQKPVDYTKKEVMSYYYLFLCILCLLLLIRFEHRWPSILMQK